MRVGGIKTWKELTIGVQQLVRLLSTIILKTPDSSFNVVSEQGTNVFSKQLSTLTFLCSKSESTSKTLISSTSYATVKTGQFKLQLLHTICTNRGSQVPCINLTAFGGEHYHFGSRTWCQAFQSKIASGNDTDTGFFGTSYKFEAKIGSIYWFLMEVRKTRASNWAAFYIPESVNICFFCV